MERELLEGLLADGWSLKRIGALVDRHPSTVAYWLKRYGLVAVNREKYAPKGGIGKEVLAGLTEDGLTLAEMASHLGVSVATIRYWLARHGLRAGRHRRADSRDRPKEVTRWCSKHGRTRFVLEGRGYYRCARCRLVSVAEWRRALKAKLVSEAGGRCVHCGYDRYRGALQFHHLDPATKEFSLSMRGLTRSIEKARLEVRKCVLLCANCHAEIEAGLITLPELASLPEVRAGDSAVEGTSIPVEGRLF